MQRLFRNFTRVHGYVTGGLVAIFISLSILCCLVCSVPRQSIAHTIVVTLAMISGPYTGALARPDEPFCWTTARSWLPATAAFLLVAVLCQVLPLPFKRGAVAFRVAAWIIGLVVWFGSAIISLLSAYD
jgi:lysylphosphatidylglycerol synthetase-like protein (DUF2156 family)